MPFSTPPTFVDGNILSASQLNTLTNNDLYFRSLLGNNTNTGFMTEDIVTDRDSAKWVFRRTRQYIHYNISMLSGDSDRLIIYVNGAQELNDGVNRTGYTWTGYFDLDTITNPVTEGDFYEVYINIEFISGSLRVNYFIESDDTSI